MRNRRHTINTPPPLERTGPLPMLIIDDGSVLTPPSAIPLDLNLPSSHGLPSWGVIASAISLQAPGCWVSYTRYVAVAMYAPAITFITTLEQWEVARKTPLKSITRLTVLRANLGLPIPAVPGAAEAFTNLAQVLQLARPAQAFTTYDPRSPVRARTYSSYSSNHAVRPIAPIKVNPHAQYPAFHAIVPEGDWPELPGFAPLHERRGVDLPVLHIPRGRPRPPPQLPVISAQSLAGDIISEPSTASTASSGIALISHSTGVPTKTQAIPLTGKVSWGNWFTWSP